MKRRWMALLLVCCMLFSLTACAEKDMASKGNVDSKAEVQKETEVPASTQQNRTLQIGFSTGETDPRVQSAEVFRDQVEKQTDGRIAVEIHTDGELGSDAQLIQGVIDGTLDMTVSSAGNFANYVAKAGASAFPFLFSGFEEAWEFIDSDEEKELESGLEQFNIKVLAHFDNGFRCITTSKKAGKIRSVSDMKDLKIRTPENQVVMETLSALGANPYVLDFTELYDALKKGEFDAQENPVPIIYNQKLYEVQSYLAITNHSYDAMPFVISQEVWDSLDKQDQEILETAALEAQTHNRKLIQTQTTEYIKKLKKQGMKITYPDLEEFKAATAEVYDYFAGTYGEELMQLLKNR